MSYVKFDTEKIMEKVRGVSEKELQNRLYEVECPHCHESVSAPTGISACPLCSNEIDLTLDISFK